MRSWAGERIRVGGRRRALTGRHETDAGAADAALRTASEGIAKIADAAEGAISEMEAAQGRLPSDATRITRERLVSELLASVAERAEDLRAEAAKLDDVLRRATARLNRDGGPPALGPASAPASPAPVPFKRRPSFAPSGPTEPPRVQGAPHLPEGARLLATQMAVAGSAREEIEHRLASQFGVEDPKAVLDEVFRGTSQEKAG